MITLINLIITNVACHWWIYDRQPNKNCPFYEIPYFCSHYI